jgi:hypothetical protein
MRGCSPRRPQGAPEHVSQTDREPVRRERLTSLIPDALGHDDGLTFRPASGTEIDNQTLNFFLVAVSGSLLVDCHWYFFYVAAIIPGR